jgi:hypothetical protein
MLLAKRLLGIGRGYLRGGDTVIILNIQLKKGHY